jgi:hypothetical protein
MTHDNGDRSDDGDDYDRESAGKERDDVGGAAVIPVDVVEHNPVEGHADPSADPGLGTKTVLAAGLAVGVVLGVLAYVLRRLRH